MTMLLTLLSLTLFLVFTVIAIIHFYWTGGGKWGLEKALPTKINGEKALEPRKIDCIMVGVWFGIFAFIYLLKPGLISVPLPSWLIIYSTWIIPSIFILRAIGDFKYVGFFKSIKSTVFGKTDTKWLSPFCLLIGLIGIAIQLIN